MTDKAQTQIWHDKNEKPDNEFSDVLVWYNDEDKPIFWTTDDDYENIGYDRIIKWCYLDDLLSQAANVERYQIILNQIKECNNGNKEPCPTIELLIQEVLK